MYCACWFKTELGVWIACVGGCRVYLLLLDTHTLSNEAQTSCFICFVVIIKCHKCHLQMSTVIYLTFSADSVYVCYCTFSFHWVWLNPCSFTCIACCWSVFFGVISPHSHVAISKIEEPGN